MKSSQEPCTTASAPGNDTSDKDSIMKKRKLAAIAAMAAIGLFSLYQCTTPPSAYKIDSRSIAGSRIIG